MKQGPARKRWLRLVVSVVWMALWLTGCSQWAVGQKSEAPMPPENVAPAAESESSTFGEPPLSGGGNFAGIERLIIRNASLDIVVADTQATLDEITALVEDMDGYIVQSNVYRYQEGLQASVTMRIPADRLDDALDRIRTLAVEVRRESISGEDVTDQYVDLQSELRHLEATEAQLLEFLEAAEDTEAALDVYEHLQTIQANIEQVKGRIQYLEQSAALATITLDLTPDELAQPIQVGGWHPEGTARDALQALVHVLQFLVDALIVIVILVLPVLLIITLPLAGLFYLGRVIVRRRRVRRRPSS